MTGTCKHCGDKLTIRGGGVKRYTSKKSRLRVRCIAHLMAAHEFVRPFRKRNGFSIDDHFDFSGK